MDRLPRPSLSLACCVVIGSISIVLSCGDNELPDAAPTSNDGGATGGPISGRGDGGARDADSDGSTADASVEDGGTGVACRVASTGNQAFLLRDGRPAPFTATHTYVGWSTAPCSPATLIFALTTGGCEPGSGAQLSFAIPRSVIGTGVTTGINLIRAEPADLVRIRFVLPDVAPATYGTCTGAAGTVTFTALGGRAGDRIAGTYDVALPSCESSPASVVSAAGSFDVQLEANFEDACP